MPITPSNNRIHYGTYSIGISKFAAPTTIVTIRGAQGAGVSGRINVMYVHEIGNLSTYENHEESPEVELSLTKVLDGYAPIYCLATQDAASADIAGRSNQRCNVFLSVHNDNLSRANTNQVSQLMASGLYVSSVGYNFTSSGEGFTEDVTLVGNNAVWTTGTYTFTGHNSTHGVASLTPAAAEGVNCSEDFLMASCLFPKAMPGISTSGTNDPLTIGQNLQFAVSFDSISVSASFGRDSSKELGRKAPYNRFVRYPVSVQTQFQFRSKMGFGLTLLENGSLANGDNTADEAIKFVCREGLVLDLGTRNRLNDISESGAGAGDGSDRQLSMSYTNENDLIVKHTADPTTALRP